MHRFSYDDHRVQPNAIIGFAIGVVVSYIVQCRLPVFSSIFGCAGGGLFSAAEIIRVLIIVGVGGLWYKFRNVV